MSHIVCDGVGQFLYPFSSFHDLFAVDDVKTLLQFAVTFNALCFCSFVKLSASQA